MAALAVALSATTCGGATLPSQSATSDDATTSPDEELGPECVEHTAPQRGKPLIVEWPASDRAQLEAAIQQGIVAVRYTGCSIELFNCRGQGAYKYTAVTPKKDQVTITNADELYASLPLGAVDLQAELRRSGRLEIDMAIVGRYETNRLDVQQSDLEGDCANATHFASGFTVGAFRFFAGGEATIGGSADVAGIAGGGVKSSSERQKLKEEGDLNACEPHKKERYEEDAADEERQYADGADGESGDDELVLPQNEPGPDYARSKAPPPKCAGLLRIEVLPLAQAGAAPAGLAPDVVFRKATKELFDLTLAQKFDEIIARYRMPRDRFDALVAGKYEFPGSTEEAWAKYERDLKHDYDVLVEKKPRWGRVEGVEPAAEDGLDLIRVPFRFYYGEGSDKVEAFTFIRDRRQIYILQLD